MIHLEKLQLKAVQKLEITQERTTVRHQSPAGGGELLQDLGRKRTVIVMEGVFSGTDSPRQVEKLSQLIHQGKPVPFSAPAVAVAQVIIKKMRIAHEVGHHSLYRYYLELEEWQTMAKPDADQQGETDVALGEPARQIVEQIKHQAEQTFKEFSKSIKI